MTRPSRPVSPFFLVVAALAFPVTGLVSSPTATSAALTPCNPSPTQLVNAGFETPTVGLNNYGMSPDGNVPGWGTTDSLAQIEIWGSGFGGVPSFAENQFAELNANSPSTLFQDVTTSPGELLFWTLAHRARDLNNVATSVTDVMRVMIGAPNGTLTQSGPNLASDDSAWSVHTGTYVVPAGQTSTRFAFEAVSSGSGVAGAGNFLDAISFSGPACLASTLTVSATQADLEDELTYTLVLSSTGGAPTTSLDVSIPIPAHTSYVTGSAHYSFGSTTTSATSVGSDVVFNQPIGSTQPGVLSSGQSMTFTFKVTVDNSAPAGSITNTASISAWPLDPSVFQSNSVATNIGAPSPAPLPPIFVPPVNTVVYDSQGGTDVPPGRFTTGNPFTVAPPPSRPGYTFDGWYEDSGTLRTGTYTPTETTGFTLYARWSPSMEALPTTGPTHELSTTFALFSLVGGLLLIEAGRSYRLRSIVGRRSRDHH